MDSSHSPERQQSELVISEKDAEELERVGNAVLRIREALGNDPAAVRLLAQELRENAAAVRDRRSELRGLSDEQLVEVAGELDRNADAIDYRLRIEPNAAEARTLSSPERLDAVMAKAEEIVRDFASRYGPRNLDQTREAVQRLADDVRHDRRAAHAVDADFRSWSDPDIIVLANQIERFAREYLR